MQFDLLDVLSKIFVFNPDKRITAHDALNHKYLSKKSLLDTCISNIRNEYELGNIDNIEECVRHMY